MSCSIQLSKMNSTLTCSMSYTHCTIEQYLLAVCGMMSHAAQDAGQLRLKGMRKVVPLRSYSLSTLSKPAPHMLQQAQACADMGLQFPSRCGEHSFMQPPLS